MDEYLEDLLEWGWRSAEPLPDEPQDDGLEM